MTCTQEQYEQARAAMGKCPTPSMGAWLEQTMDFIAEIYDFDKSISFAQRVLGLSSDLYESPETMMERAREFLDDMKDDLENTP